MSDVNSEEIDKLLSSFGRKVKELRLKSGYKSYEVFAWENNLSRIQYLKMEQGINCTLKSLYKILKIHNISFQDFFSSIEEINEL